MTEFESKVHQRWPKLPHQLRTAIKRLHQTPRNIELRRDARVLSRKLLSNHLDVTMATTLIEQTELPQVQRAVQGAL